MLALAAAGVLAALGVLAAQASAAGSKAGSPTAAQDQYSTPTVVTPTTPMKPPSHQASAPIGKPAGAPKPTLPFTGLSLLKVVLVGAALLVLGVLLRRGLPRRGP